MGLERIFGYFGARRGHLPTYLIHFKWTFEVDITTPENILAVTSSSVMLQFKTNIIPLET